MISSFQRPTPPSGLLPLFSSEAPPRLARFGPPFRFTSFFAPEDTLLCVIAAEDALARVRQMRRAGDRPVRVVELTSGSGLVGLRLLDLDPSATLLGVDVDAEAPVVAAANAATLGLAERARFAQLSVWDAECERLLARELVDVLICNPPYIPEPPGEPLAVEAGSGPDGAAHLRRVAELAERTRPRVVALSWCSVSDPAGVAADMERSGYHLAALYAVAIADGEYSGLVRPYLERLPTAFINSAAETRAAVAADSGAHFAYVLLAGVWEDQRPAGSGPDRAGGSGESAAPAVERLMRDFAGRGLEALRAPRVPCRYQGWLLDRWDEVALRAMLHGAATSPSVAPRA